MKIPENKTTGELIPAIIVEFQSMPLFICTYEYWREIGYFRGFIKEYSISISEYKALHERLLNPTDFPTQAWEG